MGWKQTLVLGCVWWLSGMGSVARAQPALEGNVRRIAVLVGSNAAAPGRQPLRYAHGDVRRVASVLPPLGCLRPG